MVLIDQSLFVSEPVVHAALAAVQIVAMPFSANCRAVVELPADFAFMIVLRIPV